MTRMEATSLDPSLRKLHSSVPQGAETQQQFLFTDVDSM